MKELRRLKLRQGQELSSTELMNVSAGTWVQTGITPGTCVCKYAGRDRHSDILHGYTVGTDWGGVIMGSLESVIGIGSVIIGGQATGLTVGGSLLLATQGAYNVVNGYNTMMSSFGVQSKLDYLATFSLINENTRTHILESLKPLP